MEQNKMLILDENQNKEYQTMKNENVKNINISTKSRN
jgi:hypothetical protein